jgi:hypothetical protein
MPDVSIICCEPRGMRRASDAAAALQADWMATRASNKTSNKASNTKIDRRYKALIYIREFGQKFRTGALHPLYSTISCAGLRFSAIGFAR